MVDLEGSPQRSPGGDGLSRLCARGVASTGTDGGSVTVVSSHGVHVLLVATDATSATLQRIQSTIGEGPAVDAWSTPGPVLIPDLSTIGARTRWPGYTNEAATAGVAAVFAFPLQVGAIGLGILALHRRSPGELTAPQLSAALSTVDHLAASMLDLDGERPSGAEVRYDMVVHQAAGMLMVQLGVAIDEALMRLRAHAFGEGVPINELAARVVAGHQRFEKESS